MTHRTVGDVMTADVISVREVTPFKELAGLMAAHAVSALPVLGAAGQVTGVVSESDLLAKEESQEDPSARRLPWWRRRAERSKAAGVTARDLMTSPAITIGPDATVVEAARVLDRHRIKRLPVVGAGGRLAGIVSRPDLLQVFLRSDQQIADDVLTDVFASALGTNPALVRVDVSDGVVTLAGEVAMKSMVACAVRLTHSVDGVVDVVDRLTFGVDDTALPKTSDMAEYQHARFPPDEKARSLPP